MNKRSAEKNEKETRKKQQQRHSIIISWWLIIFPCERNGGNGNDYRACKIQNNSTEKYLIGIEVNNHFSPLK